MTTKRIPARLQWVKVTIGDTIKQTTTVEVKFALKNDFEADMLAFSQVAAQLGSEAIQSKVYAILSDMLKHQLVQSDSTDDNGLFIRVQFTAR